MPQPFNQVPDKFSVYSPQGRHRAVFSHFTDSGLDVFSSPTSQNPDGFLSLLNVLPSVTGGFNRRWGVELIAPVSFNYDTRPLTRFFPYQVSAEGAISGDYYSGFANCYALMATDNYNLYPVYEEAGSALPGEITGFTGSSDVFATTSRDFLYAFNGVDAPVKNHIATNATQTLTGFVGPTGVNIGTGSVTDSGIAISAIGTGIAYNASTTTAALVDTSGSGSGCVISFGFANDGIHTGAGSNTLINWFVTSTGHGYNPATTTVVVTDTSGSGSGASIIPYFNAAGGCVALGLNGPMVFNVGRKYAIAYQNSKTGHTSDIPYDSSGNPLFSIPATYNQANISQDGATTNPVVAYNTGCSVVTLGICINKSLPATIDPQIDTVLLMATSDGGDEEHLYQVASFPLSSFGVLTGGSIPAGTFTRNYGDVLPDTYANNQAAVPVNTLLEQNLLADLDSYGNTVGILGNEPPSKTLTKPVIYQGRMFTTDGKTVYFSKSLAEVTTSTGLITAKWEEAWPASNRFDIGFDNEQITGLLSNSYALFVGTTQNIYILTGTDINSFSLQILFPNVGLLDQDSWTTVYKEFMPAGYMWVTPDLKVMLSDFNTYKDVGTSIYPLLQGNGPFYIQPWNQGPYSLALLRGSDNGNIYVFNLKKDSWYEWNAAIGSGPLYTYVTSSGIAYPFFSHNMTTVPSFPPPFPSVVDVLGRFNPAKTTDDLPASGTFIPWTIQTGWQDLGDSTLVKVVNELECWTAETALTTSIQSYCSDGSGTSVTNTRTTVLAPTSAMNGLLKAYFAGANTGAKFHSFKFSGPGNSVTPNVLDQFVVDFFPFGRF